MCYQKKISCTTFKALAAVFLLSGIWGCSDELSAAQKTIPKVKVFEVMSRELTPSEEFVGRTQATQDIKLKSKVRGNLMNINFDEGSTVNKGDLLFELDPAQYLAALKSATGQVARSKAAYDTSVRNLKRGQGLVEDKYISQADYDKLVSIKLQNSASLQSAIAEEDKARLELSYTKIYAPFSGRIGRTEVFVGDLIIPEQTELANLVQLEPIWVNFQLPEKVLLEVRSHYTDASKHTDIRALPIKLRFPDGSNFGEIGNIDFIDNRVDPTTGTLAVRAEFANKEQVVVPGLYVTAIIEAPIVEQVMLIPQKSVQEDQQGRYVLIVDDNNLVNRKNVKLGKRYGIDWELKEGLSKGERVITEGLQKVRMGAEVELELEQSQLYSGYKL
ncbi:efflux RND transporter periplasmic adaptor subunit [Vibrio mediterranei]|uniref:Efflux RND transporter periplasmic adaptor subunit n=1 Tax=Vibrio mediterranei TaxID=689 RepID=A0A3G4VQB8_9VIBR|nr:efflux RND transporter periplasmic adaptor subunit [Vibrio mediterranei]AYV25071.1 efflux RND transporter periplasmic adaptor subunit [Vibrio mediterranei]MCG9790512.1 efflux RND transporter periplasmic adaptor subunit [Vibrio mediterranei]